MSNLAYAPVRRPREEEHLVAVPRRVRVVATRAQKRARPKMAYALLATAVIFAIFLAQLLISIALSSGAYQIDGLQAAQQSLGRTTSSLNERLNTLGSSQNLVANATALGMVGSANSAFLQLSNGAVLGSASAAPASHASVEATGAADSVSNSLLTGIPVVTTDAASANPVHTESTGSGHGDTNAAKSVSHGTESTGGQATPADTASTAPASSTSPDSGELPSPVTR